MRRNSFALSCILTLAVIIPDCMAVARELISRFKTLFAVILFITASSSLTISAISDDATVSSVGSAPE